MALKKSVAICKICCYLLGFSFNLFKKKMEEICTTSAAWRSVRFNKNQSIAQQSCALHDNKY